MARSSLGSIIALLASASLIQALPRPPNGFPSRIIGGVPALEGQFPHQVSVRVRFSHICGGSIISDLTVLTAAHCIFTSASDYSVVAGTLTLEPSSEGAEVRSVQSYRRHEGFDDRSLENDLALLFLDQPLTFDPEEGGAVPTIGLIEPSGTVNATGNATVSGWGVTVEGGSLSNKLMSVQVALWTDTQCKEAYGAQLKPSMICAGIPKDGGKDSCQGDSGGPLVIESAEGGKFEQVGIVSWGTGCGRPGLPGVYTEVAYFKEWIQKHIKKTI